jgi:hypothetical protein
MVFDKIYNEYFGQFFSSLVTQWVTNLLTEVFWDFRAHWSIISFFKYSLKFT